MIEAQTRSSVAEHAARRRMRHVTRGIERNLFERRQCPISDCDIHGYYLVDRY
jgi:hypothetical protein